MKMIVQNLKYVHEYRDRHGKLRRYLRRPGEKQIALPGELGSPEFMAAYYGAPTSKEKTPQSDDKPRKQTRTVSGSLSAAISAYYADPSFQTLGGGTRKMRRAILERLRERDGMKPFALMHKTAVAKRVLKRKPWAQRNWLKTLRGLMKFGIAHRLRTDDPTVGLEEHLTKAKPGRIHTWSDAEIETYEKRHPIGTKARLAMTLMLYTGQRKSDMVRMGPQHIEGGKLIVRQKKTGMERADEKLEIPVHPELAHVLTETLITDMAFLVTEHGKPFTAAGFGNKMREWCDEAGLPQCSSHGLRKAICRKLAEAGCSAPQIQSISGHKSLSEVQRYIEGVNQVKLAEDALAKLTSLKGTG